MSSVSLERMTEAGAPDIISDMTKDIFGQSQLFIQFLQYYLESLHSNTPLVRIK